MGDRRPQGRGWARWALGLGGDAFQAGLEPRALWSLTSRLDLGGKCRREETRRTTGWSPSPDSGRPPRAVAGEWQGLAGS